MSGERFRGAIVRFLDDGYAVASMLEGEVRELGTEFALQVPVTLYDEEWQWLASGFIYIGLEDRYRKHVLDEMDQWVGVRTARTPTEVP